MNLDNTNICKALDIIAETALNVDVDLTRLNFLTSEEKNIIFSLLAFLGVVKQKNNSIQLSSASASLFIKSISEFIKQQSIFIPVWDNRTYSNESINRSNVFISSNFLDLFEHAREQACSDKKKFVPVKQGVNVRAAIIRHIWGKPYVLMQYSDIIKQYQLIGGMVLNDDASNKHALKRKLGEEVPELVEYITQNINCEFESERADEEVFFSQKYGVYARYKTLIFSVRFNNVTKDGIKAVSKNPSNKWISIKEIENGVANDGKKIFSLPSNAIDRLKHIQPTILVAQHDINILLEKTWVKVLLAITGLSGLVPLLFKLIEIIIQMLT